MTDNIVDDFLAHYGVQGMKWGVRHDPGHEGEQATTRKIAKLDKQWAKKAASHSTYFKIYNGMADAMNSGGIDRINNSPEFKDKFPLKETVKGKWDNPTLAKKYFKTYSNEATRLLNVGARDHGLSASGNGLVFEYDAAAAAMPTFSIVHIGAKHAGDSTPEADVKVVIKDGYITAMTVTPKEEISHLDTADDILAHYGVLGMHWGQHKVIDKIRAHGKERSKKKKAIEAVRKANSVKAREAGYKPAQRENDLHQVKQDGVWRIEKNITEGQPVHKARMREYGRATSIGLGIGAGLLAINYSPIALARAKQGLIGLALNVNAKRGAKVAANLFADNRGITSYSTVALAFDKVKGVWA